jgi:YjbE family integral membrane protein
MEGIFSIEWFTAFGSILLLDIILSGDNAILIALACKNLADHQKLKAMLIGGFGAVFIRVVFTLFATGLLSIPYIEFLGGAALLYIAVKLLTDHSRGNKSDKNKPPTLAAAVKTILAADFIMSIDNILSLAGVANTVSDGKWSLIICGLLISIPIVLCGAQFFLMLMLKVPAIIYAGSGILAFTAAKMMIMDKAVGVYLVGYAAYIEVLFIIMVIFFGWYKNKRQSIKE